MQRLDELERAAQWETRQWSVRPPRATDDGDTGGDAGPDFARMFALSGLSPAMAAELLEVTEWWCAEEMENIGGVFVMGFVLAKYVYGKEVGLTWS